MLNKERGRQLLFHVEVLTVEQSHLRILGQKSNSAVKL